MKNYYDMLSVASDAPADEIKKAFRREIARYHPDKVQHLGAEFQEMAAGIAADLTEAYRILMDPTLRAKYDTDLRGAAPLPRAATAAAAPAAGTPFVPPAATVEGRQQPPPAAAPQTSAGLEFVRRAALAKIREAMGEVLEGAEPLAAAGFDLAIVTKPKKPLFRKAEESSCVMVKFVPFADAAALNDVWLRASKVRTPGGSPCTVLLLGHGLAPAKELAAAVTGLRRGRATGPLVVPVDVRDWEALFPPETPGSVRSLIQRLKEEKR